VLGAAVVGATLGVFVGLPVVAKCLKVLAKAVIEIGAELGFEVSSLLVLS
jgi:hypothetical protein